MHCSCICILKYNLLSSYNSTFVFRDDHMILDKQVRGVLSAQMRLFHMYHTYLFILRILCSIYFHEVVCYMVPYDFFQTYPPLSFCLCFLFFLWKNFLHLLKSDEVLCYSPVPYSNFLLFLPPSCSPLFPFLWWDHWYSAITLYCSPIS